MANQEHDDLGEAVEGEIDPDNPLYQAYLRAQQGSAQQPRPQRIKRERVEPTKMPAVYKPTIQRERVVEFEAGVESKVADEQRSAYVVQIGDLAKKAGDAGAQFGVWVGRGASDMALLGRMTRDFAVVTEGVKAAESDEDGVVIMRGLTTGLEYYRLEGSRGPNRERFLSLFETNGDYREIKTCLNRDVFSVVVAFETLAVMPQRERRAFHAHLVDANSNTELDGIIIESMIVSWLRNSPPAPGMKPPRTR